MEENKENIKDVDCTPVINNDAVKDGLEAKSQELMELISDPRVMRSYRAFRNDLFGIGERKPMTKSEKKKKKAKRRMVKKSKR